MVKRALLVGCNYPGTANALRGCVNDVWGIKAVLEEHYGFSPSDIVVMIDTDPQYTCPTGKNMKAKLTELVAASKDGDVLVFHFSGHGTQIPSANDDENDGKDEAICPSDLNVICDDDLRAILKPLEAKPNVKFTFIADCCHSGTLLDHEEVIITGPKDGSAPPPTFNADTISGFLSLLGNPGNRDFKNRALPFNDLAGMLSQILGQPVGATNIRSSMGTLFGADASGKIQQFMKTVEMIQGGINMLQGKPGATMPGMPGGQTSGAGGLMSMLCACLAPKADSNSAAAAPNGHAATPNPLAAHPTATGGASATAGAPATGAGGYAIPDFGALAAGGKLPSAGTKPPPNEQLSKDIGILITGCQSNQTSADACPSGDPNKAHGALSNALQTVVKQHFTQNPGQPLPYRNLVVGVRDLLSKTGFTQNPCLECSAKNADSAFIVH